MVAPPRGVVNRGVTAVRGEPNDSAELVDQAHYGEPMTCLGERNGWTYVQGPDLYFGWIRSTNVALSAERPDQWVVAVPLARARVRPSPDADAFDELPAGTPVGFGWKERHGDWWRIAPDGWLLVEETVERVALPHRYPTPADLLATAEPYLGVPYLWGGTSAHGIDCSGLTQQVYRLNGVGLDRDADQQALGGKPVDVAGPGDLFFFGKDRVTHTAIATGERTFIHAPQSGQRVERGELTEGSPLRAIRRYLP
jgi:gamma-D-glutamyl-L-lysine dipeptidyl-peptidase